MIRWLWVPAVLLFAYVVIFSDPTEPIIVTLDEGSAWAIAFSMLFVGMLIIIGVAWSYWKRRRRLTWRQRKAEDDADKGSEWP